MPTDTRSTGLRYAIIAGVALSISAPRPATAAACSDQKGKVIFEDSFADDLGGWPSSNISPGATATFGKSDLTIHLVAPAKDSEMLNTTFFPKDGDYCLQVKVPASDPDGSVTLAALRFLDSADSSYFLGVYSSGFFVFKQYTNKAWQTVASKKDSSIKPGDVVSLDVTVHNGLVTVSGNGEEFKRVRVPIPDGSVHFGVQADNQMVLPSPGMDFEFVHLKITSGN